MVYAEDRAWKKLTKREPKMSKSLVPSPWIMRLAGETTTRRVYEDWNAFKRDRSVKLVILIGDEKVTITRKRIDRALASAEKEHAEWVASIP